MNSSARNRKAEKTAGALSIGEIFSMTIVKRAILLFVLLACSFGTALAHMGIETSEFQTRRLSVMDAVSDGIVLLHSFSAPKSWSESGFQQDSNFYYLTGLENLHDAIIAVDGTTKESWLFVMAPTERQQRRFATLTGWDSVYLSPDHQTEQLLGIDHVVAWDRLSDFIETSRAIKGLSLATPAKPPANCGSGVPVKEMLPIGVCPANRLIVVADGTESSTRMAYP
jgi:hypothetical protein